ncbi:hypothetical protein ACPEIF_31875 [Streptomyces sp. NPDC012600]|uniref:hypothetical protein n=1 Tax=Streptomyces sp. NPDC012600 TaxID=3415005 RepID=UPI003C2E3677
MAAPQRLLYPRDKNPPTAPAPQPQPLRAGRADIVSPAPGNDPGRARHRGEGVDIFDADDGALDLDLLLDKRNYRGGSPR